MIILENVERWERTVQDEQDALEGLKSAEARYRKEIDQDKDKIEQLKQQKQTKKSASDEMEEEISKVRWIGYNVRLEL